MTNPNTPASESPDWGPVLEQLNDSQPEMRNAPEEVSIKGEVVTRPSGIQQVQVTNPTPVHAPINIAVTVNATSSADPEVIGRQVADQVGRRIKSDMAGLYANRGWEVA